MCHIPRACDMSAFYARRDMKKKDILIIPRGVKEARITCHRALWCAFLPFFIARARLSFRDIGDFPGIKFAPYISEYLFFSCLIRSIALIIVKPCCALATKRIPIEL